MQNNRFWRPIILFLQNLTLIEFTEYDENDENDFFAIPIVFIINLFAP